MDQYLVTIIGHVNESVRPEGYPKQMKVLGVYSVPNAEKLKEYINTEIAAICRNGGMVVQRDSAQLVDISQLDPKDKLFVFNHMFTHLTTEVQRLVVLPPQVPFLPVVSELKETPLPIN